MEPGAFIRAPKGIIVRSSTAEKLKTVIDRLYSDDNADYAVTAGPVLAKPYGLQKAIVGFVRSCTEKMLALKGVADNDNFLVRGLDSLQAIELGRLLRSGLRQEYSA